MTKKLTALMRQDLSYCDPAEKRAFHAAGRATLRALAKAMGLNKGEYDIRSNMGGIAVSGEITLHTESVYVQIGQFFSGREVMYRTCQGRKDYTGGENRYARVWELENPDGFVYNHLRPLLRGQPDFYYDPVKERWAETMWM